MRRFLALALLFGLGMLSGAPGGIANPLLGGAAQPDAPADSWSAARLLQPLSEAVATFQRDSQRLIVTHLDRIRDGGMGMPLIVAMLLGLAYGVLHSLGPGHGKTVVASYFLAREARPWRGVLAGFQIGIVHVASAIVIVLAADLLLTRTFGGPTESRIVRLASHAIVLGVGLWMLLRVAQRLWRRDARCVHDHHPACAHGHGCETSLLALGVGLVPCNGSLLVLLVALANGILAAGLLIVLAIALGMALTLAAIGVASALSRRYVAARVERPSSIGLLVVEGGGAMVVCAVGLMLLIMA